jgi:predicted amidophosphoribosyltransferase
MPSLEHPPALAPPRPRVAAWRQWLTAAVDLVFPPFCPLCAARLGAGRRDPLCAGCWERLERIVSPCCRFCGAPFGAFAGGDVSVRETTPGGALCGACRVARPPWAYARAAAHYGDCARDALHAFKFGGRRALALPLGELLAELGPALPLAAVDVVVPVPLHPRRERERGFNQSWLLARRLAVAWGLTARADVLARRVATAAQTDLGAAARRLNVRDAFTVRRPELVAGRHVLLVDDVRPPAPPPPRARWRCRSSGAATVGVADRRPRLAGHRPAACALPPPPDIMAIPDAGSIDQYSDNSTRHAEWEEPTTWQCE